MHEPEQSASNELFQQALGKTRAKHFQSQSTVSAGHKDATVIPQLYTFEKTLQRFHGILKH